MNWEMTEQNSNTKIWKQLKLYVLATLGENYPMHGYHLIAADVAEMLMEGFVVTHKRLLGENIPLTKQGVLDRLRERYKK